MIRKALPRRAGRATVLLAAGAVVAVLLVLVFWTKPAAAAFPGTNGAIVFADGWDLYSVRPGDTDVRQLTFSSSFHEFNYQVSPDGTKIAFKGGPTGGPWGFYVMNANGTGVRQVLEANGAWDPSWSPDGQKLIYTKQPSGISNIYTVNLDGTGETRITDNTLSSVVFSYPAWSPPGPISGMSKIAYLREDGDLAYSDPDAEELYVANPDGSGAVGVSPEGRGYYNPSIGSPSWSPDGTRLAFRQGFGYEGENDPCSFYEPCNYPNTDIYAVNRDGSNLSNLTNTTADAPNENEDDPTWSPDGTKIAFVSEVASSYTGRVRLNFMNANGSGREAGPVLEGGGLDWGTSPTDTAGPTFASLKPAPGASTRDRTPLVTAKVRDDLTNLIGSDITLYVDGQVKAESAFDYYPNTDALKYFSNRLSYGRHTVNIEATDTAGNTTRKSWSFKVVR